MGSLKSPIEQALQEWVREVIATDYPTMPVMYERDGQPIGDAVPYVVMHLLTRGKQGEAEGAIVVDGGGTITQTITHYRGRVRITVVGSSMEVNAWDVMERIESSIEDPRVQVYLSGAETDTTPSQIRFAVPIDALTEAREVGASLSTAYETRVTQDFLWTGAVCREDDSPVDCIETVYTTGDVGGIVVETVSPPDSP